MLLAVVLPEIMSLVAKYAKNDTRTIVPVTRINRGPPIQYQCRRSTILSRNSRDSLKDDDGRTHLSAEFSDREEGLRSAIATPRPSVDNYDAEPNGRQRPLRMILSIC